MQHAQRAQTRPTPDGAYNAGIRDRGMRIADRPVPDDVIDNATGSEHSRSAKKSTVTPLGIITGSSNKSAPVMAVDFRA